MGLGTASNSLVFSTLVQKLVLDLFENGHVEQGILVVLGDLPAKSR